MNATVRKSELLLYSWGLSCNKPVWWPGWHQALQLQVLAHQVTVGAQWNPCRGDHLPPLLCLLSLSQTPQFPNPKLTQQLSSTAPTPWNARSACVYNSSSTCMWPGRKKWSFSKVGLLQGQFSPFSTQICECTRYQTRFRTTRTEAPSGKYHIQAVNLATSTPNVTR